MELGPFVRGVTQAPKNMLMLPLNIAERVGDYGLGVFTQSLELFAPSKTSRQFVEDLIKDGVIHDTKIGIEAKIHGEKKDDPELTFTGEAIVINAVAKAIANPNIPSRYTKSIVRDMSEAGIVPEDVPLVSDEAVEKAQTAFKKYGQAVVNMFPGRQNRL